MNRRADEDQSFDPAAHLGPLMDDDAFLTALSRGDNPREGDALGDLLLELRADVERPVPAAPQVGDAPQAADVASLDDARSRRRVSPWAAGLVGAAAATVAVVGTGAALHGATPGSPLWGASTSVFGDRAAVVELAGTLEDLDAASRSGDADGARRLLEQARVLVGTMQNSGPERDRAVPGTTTSVATTSVTVSAESPAPQPAAEPVPAAPPAPVTATETQTATVTSVATVTVTAPVGVSPAPSTAAPGGQPTVTPTAGEPVSAPSTPSAPSVPHSGTQEVPVNLG